MNERHSVGAPRGNTNALKHGFYSTRFSPSASPGQDALEDAGTLNLSAEISLLRHSIRRVVELTPPDETLESARDTLRLLCLASTAISRLVRPHYFVRVDENNETQDEIAQIVDEMRAEIFNLSDQKPAPEPEPSDPEFGDPDLDSIPENCQDHDDSDSDLHPLPFREGAGVRSSGPGLGSPPLKPSITLPAPPHPPASSFLSPIEPEPPTRIDDEFTNPSRFETPGGVWRTRGRSQKPRWYASDP